MNDTIKLVDELEIKIKKLIERIKVVEEANVKLIDMLNVLENKNNNLIKEVNYLSDRCSVYEKKTFVNDNFIEGKESIKIKIESLIKEVDSCIFQLSS